MFIGVSHLLSRLLGAYRRQTETQSWETIPCSFDRLQGLLGALNYSKTRIYQTRFLRIYGVYQSIRYQGPNVTPFTSMLNKLGYIELYISKTRIYRKFFRGPVSLKSM